MHYQGNSSPDRIQDSEPSYDSIIEAVLFVGGLPVAGTHLDELFQGVEREQVVRAVAQLNQRYHRQRRPYEIRRVGQVYQIVLRPNFASVVRRLYGHTRQVRLSQAAIEVLSLVAYKQPVSPQEIDALRGIDSASILRQLRRRNLIQTVEGGESSDQSVRYQTTRRFLEFFHLTSLDDLPRVQETLPI